MHIEKYRDGWEWKDFPSLSFEYDHSESGRNRRRREQKLVEQALADLERARECGLVERRAGMEEYQLRLLTNAELDVSDILPRAGVLEHREWTLLELYAGMEDAGLMKRVPLRYVNTEINTTEGPVSEDLGWELAYKSLRRMMRVWNELRRSFDKLSQLATGLEGHNAAVRLEVRTKQRETTFLLGLALGLLKYQPGRQRWYTYAGDETALGPELENLRRFSVGMLHLLERFPTNDHPSYTEHPAQGHEPLDP